MLFYLIADSYFSQANQYYLEGHKILSSLTLAEGLKYLGYAIHPIQDIFAHTDEVVLYETTLGVGYYSHLSFPDVDNAQVHSDVIFDKVEPITIALLEYFVNTYYILINNVEGLEVNAPNMVA